MFCEKGVLRNFAKFTGKHLCQSLFLINLQARACNFIKKETLAQVFSGEVCKIYKNIFFTEHLWTTASEIESLTFTTGYSQLINQPTHITNISTYSSFAKDSGVELPLFNKRHHNIIFGKLSLKFPSFSLHKCGIKKKQM